jgi:hypothetical protein
MAGSRIFMPGRVPGLLGVPLMMQNRHVGNWEQPALQIAASFAPDAFQEGAFQSDLAASDPTEAFVERYRKLPEKDQQAIKEGLLSACLLLATWIFTLANEDRGAAMIALCGLLLSIYSLWNKIEDI